MKRPNITPGSWHVGTNPGPIVYGPQGEQVANMFVAMLPQDEHKANTRCIAAAPDMAAALEQAYQLLKTARQYFPKRIRNSDTFQLELACAAIGSALTKAGYTF